MLLAKYIPSLIIKKKGGAFAPPLHSSLPGDNAGDRGILHHHRFHHHRSDRLLLGDGFVRQLGKLLTVPGADLTGVDQVLTRKVLARKHPLGIVLALALPPLRGTSLQVDVGTEEDDDATLHGVEVDVAEVGDVAAGVPHTSLKKEVRMYYGKVCATYRW